MENNAVKTAVLLCVTEPTEAQKKGITDFIEKKYGEKYELLITVDKRIVSGFELIVGDDVYDWTAKGRIAQLRKSFNSALSIDGDTVALLHKEADDFKLSNDPQKAGSVIFVGDGIASVSGLSGVAYGEIVVFESGIKGMAMDLRIDSVGCILFGDDSSVHAGDMVNATGKSAGVPVGLGFVGRVVNALGMPIDGKGEIIAEDYYPVEHAAHSIIERQPVTSPLETGILCVDSMFPIGKGQRELIIGDRQTGKTAIAIDTIINQKGKNVICVYVAIGQKAGSVALTVENLRRRGALDYTVVVSATAGEPAPLQYIAPYAGCSYAEYFMNLGKDVLIVYDDLSKHAIAYRTLSLLLERSPGREAYPGDVFYLHSRLLERSAHLCDDLGGGSMTALPIVETQDGDVSAYIPTNVISITDGQLFLESDLFFAGQRPAVNVGLSVSRVGGAAQTKAMKKATGTLRLDLAQYREIEVFTQFSSDLDDVTKRQIDYGAGLTAILKQKQYQSFTTYQQVVILVAALGHIFDGIKTQDCPKFRDALAEYFVTEKADICNKISATGTLNDEIKSEIIASAKEFSVEYNAKDNK